MKYAEEKNPISTLLQAQLGLDSAGRAARCTWPARALPPWARAATSRNFQKKPSNRLDTITTHRWFRIQAVVQDKPPVAILYLAASPELSRLSIQIVSPYCAVQNRVVNCGKWIGAKVKHRHSVIVGGEQCCTNCENTRSCQAG